MATRLEQLSIDEVSGVDTPANDLPGFMVLKSKGEVQDAEAQLGTLYAALASTEGLFKNSPAELLKAREEISKSIEDLLTDEDRPKESLVDKMRKLLKRDEVDKAAREGKHPTGLDEDEPTGVPEVEPDEDDLPAKGGTQAGATRGKIPGQITKEDGEVEEEPVEKAASAEDVEVLKESIFAVLDRIENIEKALTGSASPEGQETGEVRKSAPTLTDAIVSAARGNRVTIS